MNISDQLILEDYRRNKDCFVKLGDVVHSILDGIVSRMGVKYLSIEHRVKGEKSLEGKLLRSDGWYHNFFELMDILGARIICYFEDDVDIIGKEIEKEFEIDKEYSSDKRKLIRSDSFGYLSLHYICTLPKDKGYPEELLGLKFEIQIRTILQHAWSDIEHDIGYKSEFGVPREFVRGFARIAGLLELADEEFVRMRDGMKQYSADVRKSIIDGSAGDIALNMVSINEFMKTNVSMTDLLAKISKICNSEIEYTDATSYLEQLAWFDITTLGGLIAMLERNKENALKLAENALMGSDLDILSSNTALRYLCHAELLARNYDRAKMADFFAITCKNADRAEKQAERLSEKKDLL